MKLTHIALVLGLAMGPLVMTPAPTEAGNGWNRFWQRQHAKQREVKRAAVKPKQQPRKIARGHKGKYDPATQALRMRMFAGKQLTESQLKSLADKGESLAAYRFAKMLEAKGGSADRALGYYAKAAIAGRLMAAEKMLALLRTPDLKFTPATLMAARKGLQAAVKKGDTKVMTGLAHLYLDGKPLGQDREAAVKLLAGAGELGDETAALEAGIVLSEPGRSAEDYSKAASMFRIAAKRGNLIAMAKLESLGAR